MVDLAVPANHRIKLKECEKNDKYLDLARELKKTMKHEGDNNTNCDWSFWYSNQRIIKVTGGLGILRMSGDHPNYSIIENGQNTEKSPGDLRRLAVTQTPVQDHQLTLMWKTLIMIIYKKGKDRLITAANKININWINLRTNMKTKNLKRQKWGKIKQY